MTKSRSKTKRPTMKSIVAQLDIADRPLKPKERQAFLQAVALFQMTLNGDQTNVTRFKPIGKSVKWKSP